jgi:hypothetical protein
MLEKIFSKLLMLPANFLHRGNDIGSRVCVAHAFPGTKKLVKRYDGNRTKKEKLLDYLLFSVSVQGQVLLNGANEQVLREEGVIAASSKLDQ